MCASIFILRVKTDEVRAHSATLQAVPAAAYAARSQRVLSVHTRHGPRWQKPTRGTALILSFGVLVIPALVVSSKTTNIPLIVCMWLLPIAPAFLIFREVRGGPRSHRDRGGKG